MKLRRWLLGVTCAVASAGCGNMTSITPLNAPPRAMAPRAPSSIEVYSSSAPHRPHVDVSLIRVAEVPGPGPIGQRLLSGLLRQAGKLGCDALYISDITAISGTSSHSAMGTCVVYTEPAPPGSPPPGNAIVLVPEKVPQLTRERTNIKSGIAGR